MPDEEHGTGVPGDGDVRFEDLDLDAARLLELLALVRSIGRRPGSARRASGSRCCATRWPPRSGTADYGLQPRPWRSPRPLSRLASDRAGLRALSSVARPPEAAPALSCGWRQRRGRQYRRRSRRYCRRGRQCRRRGLGDRWRGAPRRLRRNLRAAKQPAGLVGLLRGVRRPARALEPRCFALGADRQVVGARGERRGRCRRGGRLRLLHARPRVLDRPSARPRRAVVHDALGVGVRGIEAQDGAGVAGGLIGPAALEVDPRLLQAALDGSRGPPSPGPRCASQPGDSGSEPEPRRRAARRQDSPPTGTP